MPKALLRSAPRDVRLSKGGVAVLLVVLALSAGALWAAATVHAGAKASLRRVTMFASEAVATPATVVRVERHGSGNDRRTVIHYRYVAGSSEYTHATTVRRRDRDRYAVGSSLTVKYLASEPASSWPEGSAPTERLIWPAFALPAAAALGVIGLAALFRRQSDLLANGRLVHARITRVDKKKSQHGTFWRVTYEWTLLSGARRSGAYEHSHKQPPIVGGAIPVLYDRDRPRRHARYPVPLVTLREGL
ncbi:MAG: DUF3592 domain-containing protein [Vicinamibacterales bacterium]